ncbi:uncharacterized protein Dwil_GK26869 [Drosophila willistoni]|uniref:Uncharacterized protein n=1 Tax=Drosophila willistoni TaxID=7260 RepID=A0A0Q9WWT7_DROWI|nr:uncharacterized protein Dwil_GK26869 [Drosophila willistoni]
MEGPLEFLQFDVSYMVLFVLIITLLEYLVNSWPRTTKETKEEIKVQWFHEETPILCRHLDSRHRHKLMTGVRRRLDFSNL